MMNPGLSRCHNQTDPAKSATSRHAPATRRLVCPRQLLLVGLLSPLAVCISLVTYPAKPVAAATTTATFSYTGSSQSFTVPTGVYTITVDAFGAQGGIACSPNSAPTPAPGGLGGEAWAMLSAQPGDVLQIEVGGQGGNGGACASASASGGYNGGGPSGAPAAYTTASAAGGGGASDVRTGACAKTVSCQFADRVVVAGGGGGGGYNSGAYPGGKGGAGGGINGGPGTRGGYNNGGYGGGGGGSSLAANGGLCCGDYGGAGSVGANGTFGRGGSGGASGAGGGGGGWYGGGGGGGGSALGGGGGGGSGNGPSGVVFNSGVRSGNGLVTIYWTVSTVTTRAINFNALITGTPYDPALPNGPNGVDPFAAIGFSIVTNSTSTPGPAGRGRFQVEANTSSPPLDVPSDIRNVGAFLGPDSPNYYDVGGGVVGINCATLMYTGTGTLQAFTVTRVGVPSYASYPYWRLQAYDAANNLLGTTGEGDPVNPGLPGYYEDPYFLPPGGTATSHTDFTLAPPSGAIAELVFCSNPLDGTTSYNAVVFSGFSYTVSDTTSQTVAAGGTVTTGANATPSAPVQVAVTTPTAGTISIQTGTTTTTATTGYSTLGQQVVITAPAATPSSPLVIVFQLDASIIPAGQTAATVQLFRNGVAIPDCPGATSASPDPCIAQRANLSNPNGNIQLTVLTSAASVWNVGTRLNITAPTAPVALGTPVTVSAPFLGAGTATWTWGDGTTSAVPVAAGAGTATATYTYPAAGVYPVGLIETLGSRIGGVATFLYVVVYDPSAGFVTGGGWISSPAGSCVAADAPSGACSTITGGTNSGANGKATFGFVSKYASGMTVPTGNTEFHFQAGALDFQSASYNWLVVQGKSGLAQFHGTGTINGQGSYGFTLTAYDHDLNSACGSVDGFRIQIRNSSGGVVYDNMYGSQGSSNQLTCGATQLIAGGDIVIHSS